MKSRILAAADSSPCCFLCVVCVRHRRWTANLTSTILRPLRSVRRQVLHFRHRRRRPGLRRRLDLAQRSPRPGGGAAPDLIHIGDRYYMAYASSGGGLGGGHASTIHVMWSKTLDPNSPDYEFNDEHVVASL